MFYEGLILHCNVFVLYRAARIGCRWIFDACVWWTEAVIDRCSVSWSMHKLMLRWDEIDQWVARVGGEVCGVWVVGNSRHCWIQRVVTDVFRVVCLSVCLCLCHCVSTCIPTGADRWCLHAGKTPDRSGRIKPVQSSYRVLFSSYNRCTWT